MYWSLNSLEQQAYSEIANRSLSSFTLNFTLESVDSSCKRVCLCSINSFPNKGKEKLKQELLLYASDWKRLVASKLLLTT